MREFIRILKSGLENKWLAPFIICYGVIMWALFQTTALIVGYVALLILILCFADDVKNIFAIIFFTPLYIKDIMQDLPIVLYGIAIGLAFVSFAVFIIRKKEWKNCVKKSGRMMLPLLVATAAFLIGGIIGYFDVVNFFITLGLSVATIILYYFALNYTENLKPYLSFLFLSGAIGIVLQVALAVIFGINVKDGVGVVWIGCEGVNTVAIYTCLGMLGAFALGKGKDYDWVTFLLGTLLFFATVRTCCRTMIVITFIAYVFCVADAVITSKKKLWFLAIIPFMGILIGGLFLFFKERMIDFLDDLINKFFRMGNFDGILHGRSNLWKWCWGQFIKSPVFGVGFITAETVPSIRPAAAHFILAHNTFLQWLTSLGVVGTLMMGYFYFIKYKTLFTLSPKKNVFVIISVLCIALSGIMDQAATMEYFIWLMPIIFLSAIEREHSLLTGEVLGSAEKEAPAENVKTEAAAEK